MATEEAAFLQAICTEPDCDTVRLVYADWLQEQGRPERAEFIRVQCRVAELEADAVLVSPREAGAVQEQLDAARAHSRRLLSGHGREWAREAVVAACRSCGINWTWDRGFIAAVRCTAPDWLQHADAFYWSPKQTLRCFRCDGGGGGWDDGGYKYQQARWVKCTDCNGLGHRGQRPFPATAQPLRKVTLTTHPETMLLYKLAHRHGFGGSPGNRIERHCEILAAEWPGLEFQIQ